MAPDIAGVTLFAFASGAPDLFTQVAALANGDHVDIELAVGYAKVKNLIHRLFNELFHYYLLLLCRATFGGGLFIICVVLAAVIISHYSHQNSSQQASTAVPTTEISSVFAVPDTRAFLRDSCAYLIASLFTLCLLWIGELTVLHGVLLVSGYFVYLAVCIATRSTIASTVPITGSDVYLDKEMQGLIHSTTTIDTPPPPPPYSSIMNDTTSSDGLSSTMQNRSTKSTGAMHSASEIVPLAIAIEDPGSPMFQSKESGFPENTLHGDEGIAVKGARPLSPRHFETRRRGTGNDANTDAVGSFDGILSAAANSTPSKPPYALNTASMHTTPLPYVSRLLSLCPSCQGPYTSLCGWLDTLPEILEDSLHLHNKKGMWRWFAYSSAPIVLFMHTTMPAINQGSFSMTYGALISACAPGFFLAASWLGPDRLGWSPFLTFWVSSSLVLYTLMFAINPIGNNPTNASSSLSALSGAVVVTSPRERSAQFTSASRGLVILRPRRCVLLALLAFLQSIVWLNSTADEVVSLFESMGRIWNIRRDILGATVLAWGETVPDLVAVVTLAKTGQGTMAIAACFGGPVFNLLISMGGPIIFAAGKNGPIDYEMTSGVLILVVWTVGVLLFLVTVVPLRCGWKLPNVIGLLLLGLYAASQAIFLITEGSVISLI